MLTQHNQSASAFSLNIGDIVFSLVNTKTSELSPNFEGPFRVIQKEHGNKVKLLHLHTAQERIAHLDSLKKVWTVVWE